jgi:uroporphyrinogen-III synthase
MSSLIPRLILTRPETENQAWIDALQPTGIQTLAWPLIEIEAIADDTDLKQAWLALPHCRAAMFVSRSAVQHFFAQRPVDVTWPQQTRAWCTGPGTQRALISQGLPQACIDAPPPDGHWDTEHLWPVVRTQVQPQDTIMLVRGTDSTASTRSDTVAKATQGAGRDWLAQQVLSLKAQIRWVVAYRRACPHWDPQRLSSAQMAAQDGSVWVFSSAQALDHLSQLLPGVAWHQAKAVATHPRIAQRARAIGFGQVITCLPTPQTLMASLESGA